MGERSAMHHWDLTAGENKNLEFGQLNIRKSVKLLPPYVILKAQMHPIRYRLGAYGAPQISSSI